MKIYKTLDKFDLLTVIEFMQTELGGRFGPAFDAYRGQFFWHINEVETFLAIHLPPNKIETLSLIQD